MDAPPQLVEDMEKWGLPLRDLYRLAIAFYKENRKILSYEDNLKLVAFTQQASHGTFDAATAPPVGVLDVIGRDRRVAWRNLGQITKVQAIEGFIDLMDRLCPQFKSHIDQVKCEREAQQRTKEEEARRQQEQAEREKEARAEEDRLEESKSREEMQRRELQQALNQQTFHQFKAYAEKQYPGNPEQQAVLIRQLQTEHYHQYMQQLQAQYHDQTASMAAQVMQNEGVLMSGAHLPGGVGEIVQGTTINGGGEQGTQVGGGGGEGECNSDGEEGSEGGAAIERANMWTRSDMKVFKEEVSKGKGDGVIRVGHGETVTVRVPTHEGGSCLYWEFATDSHDIGFGVYFEWSKPLTTEVSVHISESDEEEDDDEDAGEDGEDIENFLELAAGDDLESGPLQANLADTTSTSVFNKRPITTIIVPIYRRDCHNEVYAGSHAYPGEGVYLLKFDNSYSMWRSKTLYYRVFYTR